MKLIIKGTEMRFIYNDELTELLNNGEAQVRRASHVEPITINNETWWQADLSPVGGPKLPAKKLRKEALQAEVEWLNDNGIPKPEKRSKGD